MKAFIEVVRRSYPVTAAFLFGSWADGRQSEVSDIDIGVFVDDSVQSDDRFAIYSLGKDYDIDFDIVILSDRDFLTEDPVIVHEIKMKGIRVA